MPIVLARRALLALTLLCAGAAPLALLAQTVTPIKFQLDWRFEGPAALFLGLAAKGYYKAAGPGRDHRRRQRLGRHRHARGLAAPTTWASPTWRR